jgi:hypothetical protein
MTLGQTCIQAKDILCGDAFGVWVPWRRGGNATDMIEEGNVLTTSSDRGDR